MLVDNHVRRARWLPDGRLLAVDDEGQIIAMEHDGSKRKVVLQDSHADGGLSVCPDGRQAVYVAAGNIWRLDLQSHDATRLTSGNKDQFPVCSPDSTYLIYLTLWESDGGKNLRDVLMRMPLAGGPARQLSDKQVLAATFSPDGREVAINTIGDSNPNGEGVIDVLPVAGGLAGKSLQVAALNLLPSGLQYSPDGKAIYYTTNKSRTGNIVMQPFSGGAPTTVTSFRDKLLYDFEYDWKHQKLAVERFTRGGDIVLITDNGSGSLQK